MTAIKVGDLLDFSSHLVASTSPSSELPRSTGTVHHRPPNYRPLDISRRRRRERKSNETTPTGHVKVKEEIEEKCPNVIVKNGIICTPYRSKEEQERRQRILESNTGTRTDAPSEDERRERTAAETTPGCKTENESVFPRFSSPPLDSAYSQNIHTKQLLRKLFLTRRLLALKKLSLSNRPMAVNLDTLLPQEPSPPSLSLNNGREEESLYYDLFSPSSMCGNSLHAIEGPDALGFHPIPYKPNYSGCTPDGTEAVYQTPVSDSFNDWMTTPMALPITPPEEDRPVNALPLSLPPVSSNPAYSHMHTFQDHGSSSSVPLTPESIVSPESFCGNSELDEVLSLLSSDSATPLGANEAFDVFPSPGSAVACGSHIYHENSVSPYTSCPASPVSTHSPHTPFSAGAPSASPCPPNSLTLFPITPSDTIRDLLARDAPSSCGDVQLSENPPVLNINLQKRKCLASTPDEDMLEADDSPAKKPAAKRGRRRISVSTKKERKREQNKTAALRYRQKKKMEKGDFEKQQRKLEERNATLRATLSSMEAEIRYLTQLWKEVEQARAQRP